MSLDLIEKKSFPSFKLDDKTSFEQIYIKYWSKLYIYAFNVLHEREICEDIVQEIFIELWAKRHEVQIADLNVYLYQSVKYQIFNHFRKSKYKKQLLTNLDMVNSELKIDELYEKKELKDHLNEAISQLPEKRRLIFQLSRYEGLSNKEISKSLNISLQTVKNQISKSLSIIRKSLKNLSLLLF